MQRNFNHPNESCSCNKLKVNINTPTNLVVRYKTRIRNISSLLSTFKFVNVDFAQVEVYIYLGSYLMGMDPLLKPKRSCMIKLKAMRLLLQKAGD